MFTPSWTTSERKYKVVVDRNVRIQVSDGIQLDSNIFHPESSERFPVIISALPYNMEAQTEPIKPNSSSALEPHPGEERTRGSLEAGDPYFYARRGYVHIILSLRGTGQSEGQFQLMGPREAQDVYEVIEWAAKQPWSDGNVGMFGVSYPSMIQLVVASLNPPHLKCLFCLSATSDVYRDMFYHGGILQDRWLVGWTITSFSYANMRPKNESLEVMGREEYKKNIAELLKSSDIKAVKEFATALSNPESGYNPFIVDVLLHPLDGPYWESRRTKYENIKIPAYIGADWGAVRMHLPAAFRSWENIKSTKRMVIAPAEGIDKPIYQLEYESLRWFDHWLKGKETGIEKEAPIKIFMPESGDWREAYDWPLPETKFTPFYLHEKHYLSEKDYWPNEGSDSFFDSPWGREALEYDTPSLVENVEILGPITANIFASTTDTEVLWNLTLLKIDSEGNKRPITSGWLRGTHRKVDQSKSKPWFPHHPHTSSEVIEPGKIYEYNIAIVPTCHKFTKGSRIGLLIGASDPVMPGSQVSHLKRQYPSRITVYHNDEYPSNLILPITSGNLLGTAISGGRKAV